MAYGKMRDVISEIVYELWLFFSLNQESTKQHVFMCVCVYMGLCFYVCLHVCICICMLVFVYVFRNCVLVDPRVSSSVTLPFFFETRSLTEPVTHRLTNTSLPSSSGNLPIPTSQCWLTDAMPSLPALCRCWGFNVGFSFGVGIPLPPEPTSLDHIV